MVSGLSELFICLVALTRTRGVESVHELPGCWEVVVGEFAFSLNGHRVPTVDSRGVTVPALNAVVHHPGYFPEVMGFVSARTGMLIGNGIEARLIKLLRAEPGVEEQLVGMTQPPVPEQRTLPFATEPADG